MDLETKNSSDITTVKPLSKSIDVTVSNYFKSRVIDLVNQGNTLFLIDLSQVNFIDSSGLGALISILKNVTYNHGHVALCSIQNPVINMFNLTRMNLVFKIFANEKEGIDYLTKTKTKTNQ